MNVPNQQSQRMEEEALAWATRLDGGDLSTSELAVLESWLASHPSHPWRLAHYQQFFAQLHGTLPAMAADGALPMVDTQKPSGRRSVGWYASVATAAAIVVLCAFLWFGRATQFSTPIGHRQAVDLSDGSHADLNADTRLAVTMRSGSRRVRMERGEAVFQVAKDRERPFTVETPAGTVLVTGTTFNVRLTTTGLLEVTVIEGHVAVQPVSQAGNLLPAPRPLEAGDQLTFDPVSTRLDLVRPADVEDLEAWREGKVVLVGVPLAEAVERFSAYHGRSVRVSPDAAGLTLGGRYTLDDFDGFLRGVEEALHVRVIRQLDGRIEIRASRQP